MEENNKKLSPETVHLKSEEVQEIMGTPPQWIVRYGIGSIFLVFIVLVVGSYFFKYPDVLEADITVTTQNLPAALTAKVSGRIDTVFVVEKQSLAEGAIIASIDNPAALTDVLRVEQDLASLNLEKEFSYIPIEQSMQLGELQTVYETFCKVCKDYIFFLKTQYQERKIESVKKQINQYQYILSKNKAQAEWSKRQLESSKRLYETDSSLYEEGAITLVELENSRTTYLQQLQSNENVRISVDNQKLSIAQQEQAILDLEQQAMQEKNDLEIGLESAKSQLLSQIKQWKQSYLFLSPIGGICTFTKYWKSNQNITTGEVLATVVPMGETHIVGRIELPPAGAGKVKEGQYVNVKLDNYPYMEYGMLRVEIKHISLVPITKSDGKKAYILEVEFPYPLITNYKKELAFSQEMSGRAEIITKDLRLIQKLLDPIKELWKR